MNIRRIEAGILNAGADFNMTTTPYEVGLGRFIDEDKGDFIGKAALAVAAKERRSHGLKCQSGEPLISGEILLDGAKIGIVTAGATSPYLGHGIGIGLMDDVKHTTALSFLVLGLDQSSRAQGSCGDGPPKNLWRCQKSAP